LDVLLYTVLVVAADQISKHMVKLTLEPFQSIPIINNFFDITYVQNTGAAFSILRGQMLFFYITSTMVIATLIYILTKISADKHGLRFVFCLILGGAIGNLIDRLRFGYVIDFLDFKVWPVFNIADIAIVVGVAVLVYLILFKDELLEVFSKSGR
jgi:signal peptidase II